MHLNNLLSTSDNSPEQLIRIAGYAALYISKIDCKLVEELKSRAEEYNASYMLIPTFVNMKMNVSVLNIMTNLIMVNMKTSAILLKKAKY